MPDYSPKRRQKIFDRRKNPAPEHDYVTRLTGFFKNIESYELEDVESVECRLRYIPDKAIIVAESFRNYLDLLDEMPFNTLEQAVGVILEDIEEAIDPRWIQLHLSQQVVMGGLQEHEIMVEETKEDWQNDQLLSRLKPI